MQSLHIKWPGNYPHCIYICTLQLSLLGFILFECNCFHFHRLTISRLKYIGRAKVPTEYVDIRHIRMMHSNVGENMVQLICAYNLWSVYMILCRPFRRPSIVSCIQLTLCNHMGPLRTHDITTGKQSVKPMCIFNGIYYASYRWLNAIAVP